MLTFIELAVFARFREVYLDDDELAAMQASLIAQQIVLVTLYAKNATENIAPGTLRKLKEAFDDET